MSQQHWRTGQAAQALGIKKSTLEQWRTQGKGPAYLRIGRLVYYDPQDVHAFKESCRRVPTQGKG